MLRHLAPLDGLKLQAWRRRDAAAARRGRGAVRPSQQVEHLEARRLFAASISGGVLNVTGTGKNDVISLTRINDDDVQTNVNGETNVFDLDDFDSALLSGVGGNDVITVGDNIADVHLSGGSGNDQLTGNNLAQSLFGEGGDDTLIGAGGNDTLRGGSGNDSLDGSAGDDQLLGDADNDELVGGSGFDTLDGGGGTDSIVGNAAEDVLLRGENPGTDEDTANLEGDGTLRITGSVQADNWEVYEADGMIHVAFGLSLVSFPAASVVTVYADLGAGNDDFALDRGGADPVDRPATILGGGGNDSLRGGDGDDFVSGGSGNDSLDGADGDDYLVGSIGNDTLDGGSGDDTLDGGAGVDSTQNGESGPEDAIPGLTLIGSQLQFVGAETSQKLELSNNGSGGLLVALDGSASRTFALSDVTSIVLSGNGGDDTITITDEVVIPATISGGEGFDSLRGGGGNDRLEGLAGDDTLDGGLGADDLLGGGGRDTADYAARTANLSISLDASRSDGAAGENDLVTTDIEIVRCGSGDDGVNGTGAPNQLFGGGGNDTLIGFGGDDELYGEGGNDKLEGRSGFDYFEGGKGNDTLVGGDAFDLLLGNAGNDFISSTGDNTGDQLFGGDGTDSADADDFDVWDSVESVF